MPPERLEKIEKKKLLLILYRSARRGSVRRTGGGVRRIIGGGVARGGNHRVEFDLDSGKNNNEGDGRRWERKYLDNIPGDDGHPSVRVFIGRPRASGYTARVARGVRRTRSY